MKKLVLLIFILIVLTGCVRTSGVVPIGDDTYMISRSHKGVDLTGSMVKAEAIKEANQYCEEIGKELKIINATHKDMVPFKSDAQAEIEFQCQ